MLEFRAFEMPPHARMSLVQMLLLRAWSPRFWNKPYHRQAGALGHTRCTIASCCRISSAADFEGCRRPICTTRVTPFKLDWFAPFFEFRFPRYGTWTATACELELRQALEPWHVLGEEATTSGTSRYVDSSVERMQVKVATWLPGDRYVVTCNGRLVPLTPTGTQGEYVAGVRYRAWQPPSALHPTIGVHAPLVFDLVRHLERPLASAAAPTTSSHPGGRSYETFRSMRTRPRHGVWLASCIMGTRRDPRRSDWKRRLRISR